jgi:ATP-dependent Clp protease protease subunit
VLTHHHLAREHPIVPSTATRVLTTHQPGDPPARSTASPFHIHLPPRPTGAEVTRAVLNLLAPTPERITTALPVRPKPLVLSPNTRRRLRNKPSPPPSPPPEEIGQAESTPPDSVYERLLRERIVFLGSEVDDDVADRITAQLLLLAAEDPDKDITFYINSPGGSVTAGMAIYATMQLIEPDVQTWAMGVAAGMAQLLLSAGTPGKRYALPHARIMMRQPSAGVGGAASDIAIRAEVYANMNLELARMIAEQTGNTVQRILADWEPERWFTAEQARDYGFVDHVLTRASHI